jgi:hypothetical protein
MVRKEAVIAVVVVVVVVIVNIIIIIIIIICNVQAFWLCLDALDILILPPNSRPNRFPSSLRMTVNQLLRI